jgi:hypothetical protein
MQIIKVFWRRLLPALLAFLAGCTATVRYQDRDRQLQLNLDKADAAIDLVE